MCFSYALEVSANMRGRPEAAISRLDMAELFLSHYPSQRDEALGHLDIAIGEFGDMKMQPSLERALTLKEEAESAPIPTPALPDGLTAREAVVLGLIATGRSNREIGEELFIALDTVERHVSNILSKTGSANRTEAANYASRNGLV